MDMPKLTTKRATGKANSKSRQAAPAAPGTQELSRDDVKKRLDPANGYPSEDLLPVERAALEVLALLPDAVIERTRDVIVLM
jgi:hypothetical protein